MKRDFEIEPAIRDLLPKLSDDERSGLEEQITLSQRIETLTLLHLEDEDRVVLGDGHNRAEIAEQQGLKFDTETIYVKDLAAAQQWVIEHQLGRRNVTPEMRSYLRGKEYQAAKGAPKDHSEPLKGSTAEALGEKHGVGAATIKRDEQFAEGVDNLSPESKAKVLSGQATATKKEISTGLFCRRCKRIAAPVRDCPACNEVRQKAEDREAKKEKKAREKKKLKVSMAPFSKAAGAITRFLQLQPDREGAASFITRFDELAMEVATWVANQRA